MQEASVDQMDPFLGLGCFFLVSGLVLDIIAVATKEWVVGSDGSTSGLWERCPSSGLCVSIRREATLDAARAMSVMSVIVSGVTLLAVLTNLAALWFKKPSSCWVVRVAAVLSFLSAVLILIGVVVSVGVEWSIPNSKYGFSFWIGVATIIVFFIAGVLLVIAAIYYHIARQRRLKEVKEKNVKKTNPYVIPGYNYDHHNQNNVNKNNDKSTEDGKSEQDSKRFDDKTGLAFSRSKTYPFLFDYKYYARTHLPYTTNDGYTYLQINGSTSGFINSQLPVQQNGGNRVPAIENFQSSEDLRR